MSQAYTFSIQDSFPNHRVCPETLMDSVRTNILSAAFEYLNVINDTCLLYFQAPLSESDVGLLESLVAAHTGNPPPMPAQDVVLVSDSDAGVARIAAQPAAIPSDATEFVLIASGDIDPGMTIDTLADVLPSAKVLHILDVSAACDPVQSSGAPNRFLASVLWRTVVDDEEIDHLFAKLITVDTDRQSFPASALCLDGEEMAGDGVARLVIRREVRGSVSDQETLVSVRGYYL